MNTPHTPEETAADDGVIRTMERPTPYIVPPSADEAQEAYKWTQETPYAIAGLWAPVNS